MVTVPSSHLPTERSLNMDFTESKWEDSVFRAFVQDRELLQKLLYRNNNQHRSTVIFKQMQALYRATGPLASLPQLKILRTSVIEVAGLGMDAKITSSLVDKIVAQKKLLVIFANYAAKAVHYATKVGRSIAYGLKQRTFAALYSAWLGVTASLFKFIKSLLTVSLHNANITCSSKLTMIATTTTNSKVRASLTAAEGCAFDHVTAELIAQLRHLQQQALNNSQYSLSRSSTSDIVLSQSVLSGLATDESADIQDLLDTVEVVEDDKKKKGSMDLPTALSKAPVVASAAVDYSISESDEEMSDEDIGEGMVTTAAQEAIASAHTERDAAADEEVDDEDLGESASSTTAPSIVPNVSLSKKRPLVDDVATLHKNDVAHPALPPEKKRKVDSAPGASSSAPTTAKPSSTTISPSAFPSSASKTMDKAVVDKTAKTPAPDRKKSVDKAFAAFEDEMDDIDDIFGGFASKDKTKGKKSKVSSSGMSSSSSKSSKKGVSMKSL